MANVMENIDIDESISQNKSEKVLANGSNMSAAQINDACDSSNSKGMCHLHEPEKPQNGKIISFKEDTFKKCQSVLEVRKKLSLKYREFELPDQFGENDGFHLDCYKRFTALSSLQKQRLRDRNPYKEHLSPGIDTNPTCTRSSINNPIEASTSSGVFIKTCLFCSKENKKHKNVHQKLIACTTKDFGENVQRYARILEDQSMLTKVLDVDFIAKEIHYHAMCRNHYQRRAELKQQSDIPIGNNQSNEWHNSRKIHGQAFHRICLEIKDKIINKHEAVLLIDMHKLYLDLLLEYGGEKFDDVTCTAQHLEEKISNYFGNKINIFRGNKKRGNIIFDSEIPIDEAVIAQYNSKYDVDSKIKEVAFDLRRTILKAPKHSLQNSISIKDIAEGEISIPENLVVFLNYLICGPDTRRGDTDVKHRRINSISQDIVFAVTNGVFKPKKHLQLGMTIKSLTGSRKVIEILNRLGHTPSYNTLEEIETEMTFQLCNENSLSPTSMILSSDISLGLAFDNYDRFVETLTGKDSLHDTVAIAYQDVCIESSDTSNFNAIDVNTSYDSNVRKRRRTFEPQHLDFEPYFKKPKMIHNKLLPLDDQRRKVVPISLFSARQEDLLWMFALHFNKIDTPMWVGWNSLRDSTNQSLQKIFYLPQINASPTSHSVVAETLERSLKIAKEHEKENIAVTYDLAIAKIALQIQAEEQPKYDKIFIQLGPFHIEMAFFKIVGKFIAESGGPHILNETNVIANGSLNGFLSGKHYNRCKRIHPLLSAAIQLLHFEKFLSEKEADLEALELYKKHLENVKKSNHDKDISLELDDLLKLYSNYVNDTLNGKHGLTAQYWISYVQLINLYHEFVRSIRVGDFDLYVYCLPQIANYFFVFNHPNYARWLVRYHDNLLKISETHPSIAREFRNGKFAIQRTSKKFSKIPIDLTLEQTINGDAASQQRGISSFTNSISARQRWAKSHSFRIQIASNLVDELNLNRKEDISKELKASQISRNLNDLNSITSYIEDIMNPFHDITKCQLLNISTGKAASNEVTEFLLGVNQKGQQLREQFINECIINPSRFEERITKVKQHTFATEGKTKKIRSNGKVQEVKMERDLFGRILCIALENKIDMAEILKYPLTPIPLALCHVDGSIQKTQKVTLMKELEDRVISNSPKHVDVILIDGFYFLHLLMDPPVTFGKISRLILQKLCSMNASQIEIVFDRFITPSIKDIEKDRRDIESTRHDFYEISGAQQKRPSNFAKLLRNDNFKQSFVRFLTNDWEEDECANLIKDKKILITSDTKCYEYKRFGNSVIKLEKEEYECFHQEADTRIIYHISKIKTPANVVVKTCDTDILVIILGNMDKFGHINVWIETGTISKNTRRYIDVNKIFESLGSKVCSSLPALHAFTGCDYTASFSRKGKIRPLKILEKDEIVQDVFSGIHVNESVSDSNMDIVQKFVCEIYGYKNISKINEVRLDIFLKKYTPKDKSKILSSLTGMDAASLPPCFNVLTLKFLRTKYIANIWKNATSAVTTYFLPENYGWNIKENSYEIQWFEGEMVPKSLESIKINDYELATEDEIGSFYDDSSDSDGN